MQFNKIINSILKEEAPSREDRIRAMDNLVSKPYFKFVHVSWMGSEELPIQELQEHLESRDFPYCVTQYFVGNIENLIKRYTPGQYKNTPYLVFFIDIPDTEFGILNHIRSHSDAYNGDIMYIETPGYWESYMEYADAKKIALASPEFEDPF